MANRPVARQYLREALFELLNEDSLLDRLEQELELVLETVKSQPEFKAVLEDKQVQPSRKQAVFKEVFGEACSPVTLNFLYLLINQHREEFLDEIFAEYRSWVDQARGIQQAQVTLAEPVDEETEELIREALINLTGEKIRIITSIDPDIIGGLVVRIGDRRYDASLRRQLERMELALKARVNGKG